MKPIAAALLAAAAIVSGWTMPSAVAAQAVPPPAITATTAASEQARHMLTAVTTADDENFLRFLRENYPTTNLTPAAWLELRSNLRKLQFHGFNSVSSTQAEIDVFDGAREAWARFVVTVEPTPPYAITSFAMRMGRRPRDVPAPPRLPPAELAAAADAKTQDLAREGRFAGVVLIAKDGRPLLNVVYGAADWAAQKPNTLKTQFRFGSMGKMFTAVAIMQLAQAGKLDLTAPIGRYLKDYPNAEVASKVTTDMLLTHTGGTGDIFGPEFTAHRDDLHDGKDYVALYGARPPQFTPGSQTAYSNYGFILLGRIVEEASGLSYDEYIRRNIFKPAGMTATGNQPEKLRMPRRAVSYMTRDGALTTAAPTLPYRGTAAGGGYSTSDDLLRFANALMSYRLLDPDHTKLLTTGGPVGTSLHYDFSATTSEGRRYFGHAGGAPGMSGELRIFPDNAYTVVVLANRDPPIAGVIASFISDRLP
jgi:CubicO group peptidase (beta-lactamase class C family)